MANRKFSLILLSHDLSKKVEFTFSRAKAKALLAGLVASFLLFNVVTGFLASRMVGDSDKAQLEAENQALREQLATFDNKIKSVEQKLSTLAETDNMLRLMADLPVIAEDVRKVGVGGTVELLPPGPMVPEATELASVLDKLDRELELQKTSFREIHSKLEQNVQLLESLPTLRPCEAGYYTSGFGVRVDPFTKKATHHDGMDISAPRGTPVISTAAGTVIYAGRYYNYGQFIVIDHGGGYQTAYGHLHKISVRKGQKVNKGMVIGQVGSTGRSTAPHLHYEVRVNGVAVNPLDYVFEEIDTFPGFARTDAPAVAEDTEQVDG
ncbi:MAG: peptidoglycan DD-metalloendopeptidase family protein [bacterium]|nr:peptidoglycan DD-metalloendopeptidase family protein [bacterium]MBK8127497.1 peptidoglycan DD-metalloendopeptidase family protein [bacterium]